MPQYVEGSLQWPLGLVHRQFKGAARHEAATARRFDRKAPLLLELELKVFEDTDRTVQRASYAEHVVNVDANGKHRRVSLEAMLTPLEGTIGNGCLYWNPSQCSSNTRTCQRAYGAVVDRNAGATDG